jgi:hypothetical protein
MKRIVVFLALAQLICFAVEARILHVPTNYSTIQAGITASVNGDTILVEQGTFHENINYSSKTISVLSVSGPDGTIIQSSNNGTPVVTITGHSELAGFTIRNGNTPNSAGGGIRVTGSTVLIHGNIILQNIAISGGAIGIMSGSNVRIIDNTIMSNSASAMGGAIYCTGGTNTEIANNIIKNNYTGISGGGIFIEYGSGNFVHHNLIIYNRAGVRGGGVLFKDPGRLENNTIAFDSCVTNTAGGVAFEERTASAINNIICQNTGYGIYAYGVNPALSYNDVWNNAQGGYYGVTPGNGSITADPLFVAGSPYGFHLAEGSPCIDSGSPSSPHDPDGTVADMGAYYFNHRFAGLSFKIADTYGSQGHVIEVPLLALGFNGHAIGGLEIHIGYDQGCLEFDSLSSDFLSGADINVADGQIHLVWENISNPLALTDSVELFTMRFMVDGRLDSSCAIDWLANNLVVDPRGEPYANIIYNPGGVTVVEFHEICGHVVYYDSLRPVQGVNIALTGRLQRTGQSDSNGLFCFENIIGGNYFLIPALSQNDPGVTVADVIKVRRQIIHLESFDSPYKFVAADVNRSGGVNVSDAVKIQRYLANLDTLPSGNWTFIDSSYSINDTNWPNAPHTIGVSLGNQDISNLGFIGVRMGDVDGSWPGDDILREVRSDTVNLEPNSVFGMPGDTVALIITGRGIVNVAGIEMHLSYPAGALGFIGVGSEVLTGSTFNGGNGSVDFVWDDLLNPVTLADGIGLVSLIFRIEDNAPELITISFMSAHVANEIGSEFQVITGEGQVRRGPTGLGNENTKIPESFVLCQNHPNPFNPTTTIEYGLLQASQVSIDIYDLLGRKVMSLVNDYQQAGFHHVVWDASNAPSGIYLYKITAGDLTTTRKMLLLK